MYRFTGTSTYTTMAFSHLQCLPQKSPKVESRNVVKRQSQNQVTNLDGQQAQIVTRTPILDTGDVEAKRQEILNYFHDSFTLYESLFECLVSDDAYYMRANRLRQPLIFYYGHTSVFFINKLNVANPIEERVDPRLESILAVGVDEMSWDDLNDDHYDWPTPGEVKSHRDRTCLLYTSPSPRDATLSRMPSSA